MTDKIIVFVTCENRQQAEQIAQAVVSEKLAACVNILPGIQSVYVWEGQLTSSEEVLCLMKTTQGRFTQLQDRIRALHSYQVPEIVAATIEQASRAYEDWVDESIGGNKSISNGESEPMS
jgi:periplasmic divalent cation tolerance protein